MDLDRFSIKKNLDAADEPPGIAIVGASVFYTPQTCSHVEAEFHVRCVRRCSIDALIATGEPLGDVRLLIVDQALSDDLLDRPELYRAAAPEASVALAYRDVEAARRFSRGLDEARHGRMGYLPMSAPLEVSLSSMRMLLHREFFLPLALGCDAQAERSPPRAQEEAAEEDAAPTRMLARLTEREREVLSLVSSGKSNKEIARRLGITEHTVKLHNHNVCNKFGVANRTAAANLYFAAQRASGDAAP